MSAPIGSLELAALEITQELGWPVFPVRERDKEPLVAGGFYAASTHPEQIAEWWRRWPNANIGFAPGSVGLIVVDIDGPTGEETARAAGVLDVPTLEVITSRGVHRYFRLPEGVRIGNLHRAELDVRAHAGYVVLPPSVHVSGAVYAWRHADIANLPARVLDTLLAASKPAQVNKAPPLPGPRVSTLDQLSERRVTSYTQRVGFGLSDGRKCAAYRLAAFYQWDVGLAPDASWHCLAAWNRLNAPPLDGAILAEIHANAAKYARGAA